MTWKARPDPAQTNAAPVRSRSVLHRNSSTARVNAQQLAPGTRTRRTIAKKLPFIGCGDSADARPATPRLLVRTWPSCTTPPDCR